MDWKKTRVFVNGTETDAVAPTIISASRLTDIPAFYAEWFMNRLRIGYVKRIDRWNRSEYISLEATKFVVFWTKNAAPLIRYLREIDSLGISYYFTFTVNDYEKEGLEPKLPPLAERIKTFKALSDMIGKERVIWRFDPLILTNNISIESLVLKIRGIGEKIATHTDKLVFSFANIDRYKKVKGNMRNKGIDYLPINAAAMVDIASRISALNARWNLELATCAEEIDLDFLGIAHNKCIDGDLIRKIGGSHNIDLKDPGQRKKCQCVKSKDIGQRNSCGHLCAYCYANDSPSVVINNLKRANVNSDSIL